MVSLRDPSSLSRHPAWAHGSESAESVSLDLGGFPPPCLFAVISSLVVASSDRNLLHLRTFAVIPHIEGPQRFCLDLMLTAVMLYSEA